jgi:hypothetical protein
MRKDKEILEDLLASRRGEWYARKVDLEYYKERRKELKELKGEKKEDKKKMLEANQDNIDNMKSLMKLMEQQIEITEKFLKEAE